MPSIPLPFVVSFVLCLVLVRMGRQDRETFGLFGWLVAVSAVQAFLSGLHWSVGWQSTRLIQPVVAAVLPALAFMAFKELRRGEAATPSVLLLHLVPAAFVLALVALWRSPIDIVLFAIYLGYGVALLHSAKWGPDGLSATRLGDSTTAHKALVAVALLLILTAFVDAGVSLALAFGDARQTTAILTVASVLWLAAAGYAATLADASRPETELILDSLMSGVSEVAPASHPSQDAGATIAPSFAQVGLDEDTSILRRIDVLMSEHLLYRDPDLTLERLARRAGIPARRISGAINRVHGRNVSQFINEYRIDDARTRLLATVDPITSIMMEAGFGTKSNFHREFQRVTGMTPSAYRRLGGEAPAVSIARRASPAS
ncbi:helix-turn-helix domain-containing protein [Lichenifustis flavocetrariae]|uniref:AraC family transcriptional regulator n=1 Tax=Lichenifustis flavocetrariae TaxID=2949735 RepID=A0AA42CIB6_9HYPH|nr:AraC family transcriptional regulator [Lichenifustis flavocetrariae]MCW6508418.1 AraC family transcriptional regulator [Lichenifustis flavocetrariae]